MTAKLASAAITAEGTPGLRRISESGAGGACGRPGLSASCISSAIVRGSGRMRSATTSPTSAMPPPTNHGIDERVELEVLPGEERPEDERPERGAEERAEEDVRDRPSALLAPGTCPRRPCARAARLPFIAPTATKPDDHEHCVVDPHPSATRQQPAAPIPKPPAITGTRPIRSMSRPAGSAASAPAARKIAGPSPRIDSMPVTSDERDRGHRDRRAGAPPRAARGRDRGEAVLRRTG